MIPESINQDKAGLTPASPVPRQREPLAKGDCTHPLPLPRGSFPQSQSGEGGVGGLTYGMLCLKEQYFALMNSGGLTGRLLKSLVCDCLSPAQAVTKQTELSDFRW